MAKVQDKKTSKKKDNTPKESALYYFYSVGCAFCKQIEPVVDELIKEGHNILKLDISDNDNRGLRDEIAKKYNKQCGTPWFVDAENGNAVCGAKPKEDLLKWIDGEDIPEPPRPKGPPPKIPFHGASDDEVKKWTEEYEKWLDENSHLPNTQSPEDVLKRPRPKTEPPRPPAQDATEKDLDEWGKTYDKWVKENDHLPNLQPSNVVLDRMKQQREQMNQMRSAASTVPTPMDKDTEARITRIEQKIDKLVKHLGVK
jgi:hypothetical protein